LFLGQGERLMQIIWDQTIVEQVKKSHTVLELETFEVPGRGPITTYCVVPAEKIGINGFAHLDKYIELHQAFVQAFFKDQNYKLCRDISEHLIGQFGGELDTYYEEILKRIRNF
jgi:hypothetical protein